MAFYKLATAKIGTVQRLLSEIEEFFPEGSRGSVYFRGQVRFKWKLLPSAGRRWDWAHKSLDGFTVQEERELLHRFRRLAQAYTPRPSLSEWEALFLGRHHGLPVRLLDWTSNPLVALYNAVAGYFNKDAALWGCIRKATFEPLNVMAESRCPFDIPGVRFIYPVHNSPRLVVQSGFFTLHADPTTPLEDEAPSHYLPNDFDLKRLVKWRITSKKKKSLLHELSRMAITRQSLYPDLDGLAMGLWHTEVIRRGT